MDGQHRPDHRGYLYASASPPGDNSYLHIPRSSTYPAQQPSLARYQSYPTRDPRLIAHQTNQTLTALASAHRISPEYRKEPSPPTRDSSQRNRPYYDAQRSQGLRTTPPSSSMGNPIPKGHTCNYCGKGFGRPSALKIHLAIHTGERAFVCPQAGCHRSFSVRSNMSRHVRNVHQIWPDPGNQEDLDSGDEEEKATH